MRIRELPLLRGIPPLAGIIQPRDGAPWDGWGEEEPLREEDFQFILTPDDLLTEPEAAHCLFEPEAPGTGDEWFTHPQQEGEETHASNDRYL